MKKKILCVITKTDIGGAQKYVFDLAKNLDKNQFETKILCGGADIKWLSNKVWPFFLNDWLAIWELAKVYKKERPDIIHLNSSKAGVLGSIAASIYKTLYPKPPTPNPKVIFTAHGWVFNPTNALSFPVRWFYIFLHKFTALFQDKIICVSEYDYNLALSCRIAPKEKLTTVHNGIDSNIKFLDKETAKNEITKKLQTTNYKLQTNYPWVGSIGRLVKEKNYETLILAAALVPNAYFFIIGEGPEYKNYKLQIINYKLQNRFFLINPTGNDAQYLKAFDIFTMSSVKEGLPYILLEAMAAELPIVVTEAGGMPEVIKNHENGLMVSQKNPDLLTKTINGLLANKNIAKEMAIAAKNQVTKKFNLSTMIKKTENVYNGILTGII
ncbi:MAG: hypothetical protein A3I89_01170 [Candidatus Harrisonbacteria bacterium RIFCSPLOWO2_02_FULL_41_11]|uniref:Glycosyl transferase family 1 domain-containing protein n=1 Tax=Candidatus Harrisonbacteria bacterium RIFCSPHIGHO2_02_FULL_42_16 TaxID=1798404 RepID=A0A1G1ZI66_9BACT|nr:MAG: hypothetical protein A3B92_00660 [Candidatus Harrisonbacteria bacterium RIFCSPHIGHO2_02_FULL_42_16]OGY67582.1 MAG: hypothetical protein A3I89_01170 [Candidatus Harrisonbacteria bacterium RIFCSPLOWO2_02_FULL_41_11]